MSHLGPELLSTTSSVPPAPQGPGTDGASLAGACLPSECLPGCAFSEPRFPHLYNRDALRPYPHQMKMK